MLYKFLRKIARKKVIFSFDKKNLYNWMSLTKKERFDLSQKDSNSYIINRRNLLDQIRKEYKNIPKTK